MCAFLKENPNSDCSVKFAPDVQLQQVEQVPPLDELCLNDLGQTSFSGFCLLDSGYEQNLKRN